MGKLFSLDPKVQNLCPLYVSQKSERGIKIPKGFEQKIAENIQNSSGRPNC